MYMQSNQPIQQQDGVMNGTLFGASLGAAATAGAHFGGEKMIEKRGDRLLARMSSGARNHRENVSKMSPGSDAHAEATKVFNSDIEKLEKKGNTLNKVDDKYKKVFRGGKTNKAIAYGSSILAGGIVGGLTDSVT